MRVLGLLAAVTLGLAATVAVRPAHAGYILNFSEASGSVVASGSGSIDLTGMRFYQTAIINNPGDGWKLAVINGGNGKADFYKASFSGPSTFSYKGSYWAQFGNGDITGFSMTESAVALPTGYLSGHFISGSFRA